MLPLSLTVWVFNQNSWQQWAKVNVSRFTFVLEFSIVSVGHWRRRIHYLLFIPFGYDLSMIYFVMPHQDGWQPGGGVSRQLMSWTKISIVHKVFVFGCVSHMKTIALSQCWLLHDFILYSNVCRVCSLCSSGHWPFRAYCHSAVSPNLFIYIFIFYLFFLFSCRFDQQDILTVRMWSDHLIRMPVD